MARYDDFRRGRYDREFRGGSQRGGQTGYSRGSDGYPWGVNLDRVDAESGSGGKYRQTRPREEMRGRSQRGPRGGYDAPYRGRGSRGRGYGDRDYSPWLKYVPREYDRGYRW
ncbi:MAG: hypothetical protein ACR2F9_05700 [Longimicrobiaceae bacterium]